MKRPKILLVSLEYKVICAIEHTSLLAIRVQGSMGGGDSNESLPRGSHGV